MASLELFDPEVEFDSAVGGLECDTSTAATTASGELAGRTSCSSDLMTCTSEVVEVRRPRGRDGRSDRATAVDGESGAPRSHRRSLCTSPRRRRMADRAAVIGTDAEALEAAGLSE